jgi:phage terminase large subunit-like protein
VQTEFLASLTDAEAGALPYLFEFWAMPHQVPPRTDWHTWVVMGGRGAGKTRAGAEWVRSQVEGARPCDPGRARRVALVAETIDQAREVMVFGESGIMACTPADRRPVWNAGRKMLVWPNGAVAQLFSAHEPESLRGPQFDTVWADEVAKWKRGEEAWEMVQFCLRLGDDPRACVTTTPRNAPVLKTLLAQPSTAMTHAPTKANRANLADRFLEEVQNRFAGTRLGQQELEGVLLPDAEGSLWTTGALDACHYEALPALTRIIVAVDPPATGHAGSDDCGIVVAGVVTDGPPQTWRAFVIEDATVSAASPQAWAEAAVDAYRRHGADRLVAEVNQGGAMVEAVVRSVDPLVSFSPVRAIRGKTARAEPVAALYEQGRVRHARGMTKLEDQMCLMTRTGFAGRGSPDRVDALVWALHELMVAPSANWRAPKLRVL